MQGMCGRYGLTTPIETLQSRFQASADERIVPNFNIAPSQHTPVVIVENGQRKIKLMQWGLIPRWAKGKAIGQKTINARAETLKEKPSFRSSFFLRRCIVPADYFFEWKKGASPKIKQPFCIRSSNDLLSFAGIWDVWKDSKNENEVYSFSIVTVPATTGLSKIHHRMPLILDSSLEGLWLSSAESADKILNSYCLKSELNIYPVSTYVNSPQNNSNQCIMPVNTTNLLNEPSPSYPDGSTQGELF